MLLIFAIVIKQLNPKILHLSIIITFIPVLRLVIKFESHEILSFRLNNVNTHVNIMEWKLLC